MRRKYISLEKRKPITAAFISWFGVLLFGAAMGVFWNYMIAWSYP